MDGMEAAEYDKYWETQRFFDAQEFDSWSFEDAFSAYYDSSSPDGAASSATAKKSIAQERERRRRFNEKLYTLRSLVPSITKMDKVSIVKDAIDYIMELQEEERKLVAEISQLEQESGEKKAADSEDLQTGRKRMRTASGSRLESPPGGSPINVTELTVREAGDGTSIVTITCPRKKDTMARLCEALESLHLRILAANFTSFSGNILHTLFVQVPLRHDGENRHASLAVAPPSYSQVKTFKEHVPNVLDLVAPSPSHGRHLSTDTRAMRWS